MDEMWSRVYCKETPCWLWHAINHDFSTGKLLKVAPYGVYVVNDNSAFVNLGTSKDTGEFAVFSISLWWDVVGKYSFPDAKRLLIMCDCGLENKCLFDWLFRGGCEEAFDYV
jgi:hypothetical protein